MLEFHIEDKGSRSYWVSFSGSFDDQCTRALGELHSKLAPSRVCVFNFREVENLNSLGIRSWINLLRSFEEGRQIIFEDCTPDVISQINTLPKFTSHSRSRWKPGQFTHVCFPISGDVSIIPIELSVSFCFVLLCSVIRCYMLLCVVMILM